LELIRQAALPVAAPSANLFGHTSPTSAEHVLADLDGRIDAVLDGGPTDVGVESTVLGITRHALVIYRPGAVTAEMIERVTGVGLVRHYVPEAEEDETPESLPSPGVSLRHYAPRARLVLVEVPFFQFDGPTDSLIEATSEAVVQEDSVGVLLPDAWVANSVPYRYRWGPWNQPDVLARRLFAGLRALDDAGATVIVAPVPIGDGIAAAIRDRLQKAAR
jgi:L-threonylcarbamoyladenylate synthase